MSHTYMPNITPDGDAAVLALLEHVAAGRLSPEAASAELAEHATGIKALKDFAMLDTYVDVWHMISQYEPLCVASA